MSAGLIANEWVRPVRDSTQSLATRTHLYQRFYQRPVISFHFNNRLYLGNFDFGVGRLPTHIQEQWLGEEK